MKTQLERLCRSGRNPALGLTEAVGGAGEAQLIEAIDNIADFFRFVEHSNQSEISSREIAHVAFIKHRLCSRGGCDRPDNMRPIWRRGLTLIFGLATKTEGD
jgi:hypothetical protein